MSGKKKSLLAILTIVMVFSLLLTSCAPSATNTPTDVAETEAPAAAETEEVAAPAETEAAPAETEAAPAETEAPAVDASGFKMAMILPGSIQDADYNTVESEGGDQGKKPEQEAF
jgi:hypothetical protein